MSSNKRSYESLASLIGAILSGGILVSATGFLYSDFLNQPNIIIKVAEPNDESHEGGHMAEIDISNRGWDPANNLVLQIMSPADVVNASVQSSENLTIIPDEMNQKIIKAFSPRFVHGAGSDSKIFLKFNQSYQNDNFTERDYGIFSSFDEGSSVVLYPPSESEWYGFLSFLYEESPDWYKFYFGGGIRILILWIIVYVSFIGLLIYFVKHFIARRRQSSFIHKINKQVKKVNIKLSMNPSNSQSFREESQSSVYGIHSKDELENIKFSSRSYDETLRGDWILQYSHRHSVWDLWYTRSEDYKSEAFPLKYNDIQRFYKLLAERELLIEWNMISEPFRKDKTRSSP